MTKNLTDSGAGQLTPGAGQLILVLVNYPVLVKWCLLVETLAEEKECPNFLDEFNKLPHHGIFKGEVVERREWGNGWSKLKLRNVEINIETINFLLMSIKDDVIREDV